MAAEQGATSLGERFLVYSMHNGRFDQAVLANCVARSFADGRCCIAVPVEEALCNRYGTLHGGAIATLVDVVSTCALLCSSSVESRASGVTLELNVSYLSAARLGDTVHVFAEVLKVGRSTAQLAVTITSQLTGQKIAVGRHTKFLLGLGGTDLEKLMQTQAKL
jgi:acyl-coenzyme A thioesterase 13